MRRSTTITATVAVTALITPLGHLAVPAGAYATAQRYVLENAAPSKDTLIDRLLRALEANDPDALHRLAVTESEYRTIFLPGNVPPGKPLKKMRPDAADFAWGLLATKSFYYEKGLLQQFGGKKLTAVSEHYDKGEKEYATYRAYKQLRLAVRTDTGALQEIATGSIVEVDGQWKFMSFIRD